MIDAPTLPPIKHHEDQQVALRDTHRLSGKAAIRVAIGNFWEEATRILFGGRRRITSNQAEHCPDVDLGDRGHLEVKSVGAHRQGILYRQQVDQARRLLKSGQQLHFVYWCHHAPCNVATREDLHDRLVKHLDAVLVIPDRALVEHCRRRKPTSIPYRSPNGNTRDDRPGYRLSWKILNRLASGRGAPSQRVRAVYGRDLDVELTGLRVDRLLPPLTEAEKTEAGGMLWDLKHHRLDVVLAPSQRKGSRATDMIRVVQDVNARWYSDLCHLHTKRRTKPKRKLDPEPDCRRQDIIASLTRLAAGRCIFPWDWRLRPLLAIDRDHLRQ